MPLLSHDDLHLFNEGKHTRLYHGMGAHLTSEDGQAGVRFSVWAPNAARVSVMGDFNGWSSGAHPMKAVESSGIWSAFVAGASAGQTYKYRIVSHHNAYTVEKADPFAFQAEIPPATASRICDLNYTWTDKAWMARRGETSGLDKPVAIYETHLGSWRRAEGNRMLGYREIAPLLADYVSTMGFTHVELLPLMEHPFYGSWGYQTTGYFAATSRYGSPQDLMFLIDHLHSRGIGVILDWVPSHFPSDTWSLSFFDGTHLYEHADPRQGHHEDWDSSIFNYGRLEVRSFLRSSAMFWLDVYHADALRVDAVASMLYLDYSRKEGEWIPNRFGGRENLEAIELLREINTDAYTNHHGIQTIAEESTAWPAVSRPSGAGGLGFGLKWDMGWMHDTLSYLRHDPIHRKHHHKALTFRSLYAFHENFVLPLSHDEVVHGKGSLLGRMPGDIWQRFANLRLLFAAMYSQPGKKLLFMGSELAQWREWAHDDSLDWHLLELDSHRQIQHWVADLNRVYRAERALHELDCEPAGFEWIDGSDAEQSITSFLRVSKNFKELVLVVANYTPVPRYDYRVGVPRGGVWTEILNSDSREYGGTDFGNLGGVEAQPLPFHNRPFSLNLTLPPLGVLFFKNA